MLIPISSIAVLNRQRKALDPEELNALATSIKLRGLLHPIVVRNPRDDEKDSLQEGQTCVLCVGGRRLAAHILLGRNEIEANLKEDLGRIEAELVELEENLKRVNLTWQEETEARARIANLYQQLNPGANIRETAEYVGISSAQLSKDLSLHVAVQADPSLKAATSKGAAIRMGEFKSHIRGRIQQAETNLSESGGLAVLRQKIVTADAREYIEAVESQSIDMVFSDLPYGIDYYENTKAGRNTEQILSHYDDHADTAKDLIAYLVPHFVRVVKPTGWIVLFMCYEWHKWLMDEIEKNGLKPEIKPWIWNRSESGGNNGHWPELHAASRYEMIVVVNGGSAKLAKKPVLDILNYPAVLSKDRLHAMQKPHALCRELIERCTVVGEKVLDVTCGSGAHLAAAADLGRDFAGCDSNPNMLEPALTLVSQYYRGKK